MMRLKKKYCIVVVIVAMSIGLVHCSKENGQIPEAFQSNRVSFSGDYMDFESIQNYSEFISNLTKESLELVKSINQKPLSGVYKTSCTDECLYEPELLAILSKDKIVKIGDWIIKVDLPQGIVLALHKKDLTHYDYLLENKTDSCLYVFATTESVLSILESGELDDYRYKGTSGLFCSEPRADAKTDEGYCVNDEDENDLDYLRPCKVRYYSAGVYFSLYARIGDLQTVYAGMQKTNFTIGIGYKFDDRCDRSYQQLSYTTDNESGSFPANGTYQKLKAYESGYALKKYDIDGDFTVSIIDMWGGQGSEYTSSTLSIDDNY